MVAMGVSTKDEGFHEPQILAAVGTFCSSCLNGIFDIYTGNPKFLDY